MEGRQVKVYHVGLLSGVFTGLFQNGHHDSTLIVQMRTHIDSLSPQLWKYMGERSVTKQGMHKRRRAALLIVNEQYGTSFTRVVID